MHIKSVTASSFQGGNFSYDLAPLTVISGPNASGKTAIANAVRFVLLGKLPELGGKPGDAFKLASGSMMSVQLDIVDSNNVANPTRRVINRTLRQERGSIKASGDPVEFATPLLNAEEWFSMTERERIDFVFRSVTMPPDKTAAGILASLETLSFGEDHTEAIEAAKTATIATVRSTLNRERAFEPDKLPDALLTVEAEMAEQLSHWTREAKEGEATLRKLTEFKLNEDECSAETMTDIKNDISRLEGLVAGADQLLGRLQAQKEAATKNAARVAEIQRALLEAAPTPQPVPTFTSTVSLQSIAESLVHGRKLLEETPEEDIGLFHSAKWNAESEANKLKIEGGRITDDLEKAEANLAALSEKTACPYCKGNAPGWDSYVRVCIAAEIAKQTGLFVDNERAQNDAALKRSHTFSEWKRCESRQASRADTLKRMAALEQQKQAHERSVADHERHVERVKHDNATAAANHANRQKALREELERIEELVAPGESEMTVAIATNAAQTKNLADVREKLRAAERLQHDLKRAGEADAIATAAAARRDVIRAVKERITAIKGELVAAAFGALLDVANEIVGDVLRSPLVYHEETAQIGRWTSTGFVGHSTFSGTERALAYVAVAAALSSTAKLRVLILDELARLTPVLQQVVMANLAKCVTDGMLDQVIVIIPRDTPSEQDGSAWRVINIGGGK